MDIASPDAIFLRVSLIQPQLVELRQSSQRWTRVLSPALVIYAYYIYIYASFMIQALRPEPAVPPQQVKRS